MSTIIRHMDPSLLAALARQTAACHVSAARRWRPNPRDEPLFLVASHEAGPTARYLREHVDATAVMRTWLHTATAPDQGSPGQRLLARFRDGDPLSPTQTWWQHLVPLILATEREHTLQCAHLWFHRLTEARDAWAPLGLAPLVFRHTTAASAYCLLVVAYETLGAVSHPDAPATGQVFLLRVPVPGTPLALAGHWPATTTPDFRFARVALEAAEIDTELTEDKVVKTAGKGHDAKQGRAFRETVDAESTPLVVYDVRYLLSVVGPRNVWLPDASTAATGSFVIPEAPTTTLAPSSVLPPTT